MSLEPPVLAKPWTADPALALTLLLQQRSPGLSPGSLQVYQAMLASAVRALAPEGGLAHCGVDALQAWLQYKVVNPRTAQRYLALLDRVFRDMQEQGQRKDNPAQGLAQQWKAKTRPLPVALQPEQEARFRAAIPQTLTWRGYRDRAIIAAVLDAGLKVQELQALRRSDYEGLSPPPRFCIRLPPTTRYAQVAPSGEAALTAWLDFSAGTSAEAWLFPSDRQDTPLHAASLYRIIEQVFQRSGVKVAHKGAEVLRATFAARQFRAGRSLSYVQECLGHQFPESTVPFKRAALGDRPV